MHTARKLIALIFLTAFAFSLAANTMRAETETQPAAETPATADNSGQPYAPPLTMAERIRDTLTESLAVLREKASDSELGFVVSPISQRRVESYNEVEVRYSRKIIEEPVYEYETYKTVENVRVGDSSTGPTELKTVTRQRIKRQKGTRKVERLVRDPAGDIVRMERHPVYGPGGPDLLPAGFYGENAMAIYANLVCGVPPDDPLLAKTSNIVSDFLDAYGLPDNTWDLAWLTVAMVNLPAEKNPIYAELSRQLVNKLLLGQIMTGKAAGLWGPVCINPELLAAMIAYEQKVYEKEVKPWQEKVRANPGREHYQEKLRNAESAVEKFHHQFRKFTQLGLMFQHIRNDRIAVKIKEGTEGRLGLEVGAAHISGLPIYIYGEQIGDMEHTAVVLLALKQAAENGYLPEETAMPLGIDGKALIRPIAIREIMSRSITKLTAAVQPNGTATATNTWQVVHAFDDLGVLGLPYRDDRVGKLDSELTLLSTAQAYTALLKAVDIANHPAASAQAAPVLHQLRQTVEKMAKSILAGDTHGVAVGGHVEPLDFVLQLAAVSQGSTGFELSNRELWLKFADLLLTTKQTEEPVWTGTKPSGLAPPAGIREYFEKDFRAIMAERQKEVDEKSLRGWLHAMLGRSSRRQHPHVSATAYAMIFLAEGARPPLAAAWAWNDKPPRTNTIKTVVDRLAQENEVSLTSKIIEAELPEDVLQGIPLLMISGFGEFTPAHPKSLETLEKYLKTGGCIAVEAPANSAGMAFLTGAKTAVMQMLPGAESALLPPANEKMTEIPIVKDSNGNLKAVFLPVAVPDSGDIRNIQGWQAMEAVYQLLLHTVDPDFLSRQYAINWKNIQEREVTRAAEKQAEMDKAFGL